MPDLQYTIETFVGSALADFKAVNTAVADLGAGAATAAPRVDALAGSVHNLAGASQGSGLGAVSTQIKSIGIDAAATASKIDALTASWTSHRSFSLSGGRAPWESWQQTLPQLQSVMAGVNAQMGTMGGAANLVARDLQVASNAAVGLGGVLSSMRSRIEGVFSGLTSSPLTSAFELIARGGAKAGGEVGAVGAELAEAAAAAGPAGIAIAGVAVALTHIGAATLATENLAQLATNLNTLRGNTGLDLTQLQSFVQAAKEVNVPVEAAARGLRIFQERVSEGSPALRQMGVTSRDLGTALSQLSARFAATADDADKGRIATKLFGQFGAQAIQPILNLGPGRLHEIVEELQRSGALLDEGLIRKGEEAHRAFERLGESFRGATIAFAGFVSPAVIAGLDFLTNGLNAARLANQRFIESFSGGSIDSGLFSSLGGIFRGVGEIVATAARAVVLFWNAVRNPTDTATFTSDLAKLRDEAARTQETFSKLLNAPRTAAPRPDFSNVESGDKRPGIGATATDAQIEAAKRLDDQYNRLIETLHRMAAPDLVPSDPLRGLVAGFGAGIVSANEFLSRLSDMRESIRSIDPAGLLELQDAINRVTASVSSPELKAAIVANGAALKEAFSVTPKVDPSLLRRVIESSDALRALKPTFDLTPVIPESATRSEVARSQHIVEVEGKKIRLVVPVEFSVPKAPAISAGDQILGGVQQAIDRIKEDLQRVTEFSTNLAGIAGSVVYNAVTGVAHGVGEVIENLNNKNQTFASAFKTVWASVVSDVLAGLARIAEKWVATFAVETVLPFLTALFVSAGATPGGGATGKPGASNFSSEPLTVEAPVLKVDTSQPLQVTAPTFSLPALSVDAPTLKVDTSQPLHVEAPRFDVPTITVDAPRSISVERAPAAPTVAAAPERIGLIDAIAAALSGVGNTFASAVGALRIPAAIVSLAAPVIAAPQVNFTAPSPVVNVAAPAVERVVVPPPTVSFAPVLPAPIVSLSPAPVALNVTAPAPLLVPAPQAQAPSITLPTPLVVPAPNVTVAPSTPPQPIVVPATPVVVPQVQPQINVPAPTVVPAPAVPPPTVNVPALPAPNVSVAPAAPRVSVAPPVVTVAPAAAPQIRLPVLPAPVVVPVPAPNVAAPIVNVAPSVSVTAPPAPAARVIPVAVPAPIVNLPAPNAPSITLPAQPTPLVNVAPTPAPIVNANPIAVPPPAVNVAPIVPPVPVVNVAPAPPATLPPINVRPQVAAPSVTVTPVLPAIAAPAVNVAPPAVSFTAAPLPTITLPPAPAPLVVPPPAVTVAPTLSVAPAPAPVVNVAPVAPAPAVVRVAPALAPIVNVAAPEIPPVVVPPLRVEASRAPTVNVAAPAPLLVPPASVTLAPRVAAPNVSIAPPSVRVDAPRPTINVAPAAPDTRALPAPIVNVAPLTVLPTPVLAPAPVVLPPVPTPTVNVAAPLIQAPAPIRQPAPQVSVAPAQAPQVRVQGPNVVVPAPTVISQAPAQPAGLLDALRALLARPASPASAPATVIAAPEPATVTLAPVLRPQISVAAPSVAVQAPAVNIPAATIVPPDVHVAAPPVPAFALPTPIVNVAPVPSATPVVRPPAVSVTAPPAVVTQTPAPSPLASLLSAIGSLLAPLANPRTIFAPAPSVAAPDVSVNVAAPPARLTVVQAPAPAVSLAPVIAPAPLATFHVEPPAPILPKLPPVTVLPPSVNIEPSFNVPPQVAAPAPLVVPAPAVALTAPQRAPIVNVAAPVLPAVPAPVLRVVPIPAPLVNLAPTPALAPRVVLPPSPAITVAQPRVPQIPSVVEARVTLAAATARATPVAVPPPAAAPTWAKPAPSYVDQRTFYLSSLSMKDVLGQVVTPRGEFRRANDRVAEIQAAG